MDNYLIHATADEELICKQINSTSIPIAKLKEGKYHSSASLSHKMLQSENGRKIEELDLVKLGYNTASSSPLMLFETNISIDADFLLTGNTYVNDIDGAIKLAHYSSSRKKGLLIFDKDNLFKKYYDSNNLEFSHYNQKNISVTFSDLDENIILENLNISNKEKSVLSSIILFKTQNKKNKEFGIDVFDGSNWLYDIFISEPAALATQFKVNEYAIMLLKNSLLNLLEYSIFSKDRTNVVDIARKVENGETVIINVEEREKSLLKSALNNNAKSIINICDDSWSVNFSSNQIFFGKNLLPQNLIYFDNILLSNSDNIIKDYLSGISLYAEEFPFLEKEYLVVSKYKFPIIATLEKFQTKEQSIRKTAFTKGFF